MAAALARRWQGLITYVTHFFLSLHPRFWKGLSWRNIGKLFGEDGTVQCTRRVMYTEAISYGRSGNLLNLAFPILSMVIPSESWTLPPSAASPPNMMLQIDRGGRYGHGVGLGLAGAAWVEHILSICCRWVRW